MQTFVAARDDSAIFKLDGLPRLNASKFLHLDHLEHLTAFIWRRRLTRHPTAVVVVGKEFWSVVPGDAAERATTMLHIEFA
jgi:hypothetical protein